MATALAVQQEFAGRLWGNDPDIDYENRMVAIACVGFDDAGAEAAGADLLWLKKQAEAGGGIVVDSNWPAQVIVFPTMSDAMPCLARLHKRWGGRIRSGVNLAEFRSGPNGGPGGGSAFARTLMERSEPGGMCLSAVVESRLTSRVKAGEIGGAERSSLRLKVLLALQLAALLAYFLGWYYGIYWRIAYFLEHGKYPCWPEWACG